MDVIDFFVDRSFSFLRARHWSCLSTTRQKLRRFAEQVSYLLTVCGNSDAKFNLV